VDSGRFLKRHQAKRLRGTCVNHGSISDSRPIAFFGCPRGHRVNYETSTGDAYLWVGYSPLNPRVRESTGQQQGRDPGVSIGSALLTAQADCRFNCPGSKRTPFFQTVNTIAAILRAKLSRAIAGFIPLDSKFS
jgi:hypothetical protein